MVRVPGSSGDSGFHHVVISTTTSLNARSADRRSARRNSVDGSEADLNLDPDLEKKPHPPKASDMETAADPDSRQDPLTKQTKVKPEPYSFIDPDKSTLYLPKDTHVSGSEVGNPRSKTVRKKMKAPDDEEDEDHHGTGWVEEDLKSIYHRKELRDFVDQDSTLRILKLKRIADPKEPLIRLLKEAGIVPGSFDADALFDLDLNDIQATSRDMFQMLRILVGEVPQSPDPLPLTTTDVADNLTVSSHYASAAEDGSDTSSEPPRRMSLGPSGASLLEPRSKIRRSSPARISRRDNGSAPTDQATATESSDRSVGTLQKFFNAAMDRYLAEEREENKGPTTTQPQHQGSQDYDPDDVDFPTSAQATVATAAAGSTSSTTIQRVRISVISDLKEFTGKDQHEDRARAWISKVKAAFMRDQASDNEKCLTFADLLAGSAKNWYRQLSRPTRNKWSDLRRSFQIQYYGLGVSVARQYYHTPRRSDESPLDYWYRLNMAELRARLKIKDGGAKDRREHVNHYIETLQDQDLAERLTLLRLPDANDLEEVLRARDRANNLRAIQIQANDSGSAIESDGLGGSDSDIDSYRRTFLAANEDATPKVEKESMNLDPRRPDRDHGHQDHNSKTHGNGFNRDRCSHCGSRSTRILIAGGVLHVQSVAREETPRITASSCLADVENCITWENNMGMLPEAAEKMLNKDARRGGIQYEPSVLDIASMHL
ncbi:hypothetical protein PHMEG_0004056 [Phytophthora megakarya]|uniref:Retrotransposon gag domain-containing protein n=1 Tax=Phytophthora megakarya TaxID=4795 RepID=A0A225WUQ2_9STRA|nr:hypothetical protein PHMEG_0004056 [Phytophthora megakarya]